MSQTIDHKVTIEIETCCKCGVIFGIQSNINDRLRETGETFYCINGHPQHYTKRENLERRLKEKEEQLRIERNYSGRLYDEKEHFKKSASAQKAQKTKILNRIKNGVCPHCNRSFSNIHEHMKSKHSDKLNDQ